MPFSKLYIPLLSVLSLTLTTCESYSSHQGTVGNYYSIQIEKPVGVENPSYGWDILSFPNESLLTYSNLYIRQGGREMAFQPDAPGDYKFELIIFNSTGEAVVSNEYLFKISSSTTTEILVDTQLAETEEVVEKTVTFEEPLAPKVPSPEPPSPAPAPPVKEKPKPVKKKSPKPPPAPKADQLASVEGRFTIQIYSESTLKEAEGKMGELRKMGFDAYIQKARPGTKLWYRVRIGAFNSRDEAKKAADEINSTTGVVAWIDKVRVDQ